MTADALLTSTYGNSRENLLSQIIAEERTFQNETSTVTLLLNQLRREFQRQKKDGDLKDGGRGYQEITERIHIERALMNG